ncbi:stage III sporulation protein AG [Paenibacillus sp. MSJ-34]|uniref:stage III sporulation protein AG n=1 Tax=Paenibacillus sp. MSJ-34 TaxID=2841529 RepID=UPI001C0F88F3|nr:stage III sporulation protein AG [Paenibacillus sp. MSJ-34]MBU5443030.1 stage III sporulation protein AG [Paenibacillus sp. MSJ-34]
MAKWLQTLENWIGGGPGGTKRVQTFRWLLMLGLIGMGLLLFNSFAKMNVKSVDNVNESRDPPPSSDIQAAATADPSPLSAFDTIEQALEANMKEILEKIVGVGTVDVMVTVDSTEEVIVQRNVKDSQQVTDESDPNGGKRHITQYTRDGQIVTYESSGDQTPIVTKKIKPKIRGVLIVAKGAENRTVKELIIDAVEKGMSVPAYRISVVPRKQSQ